MPGFIDAVITVISLALDIYWWILIASAIFSWLYAFNVINSSNQFVNAIGNFLYQATEPVLRPIRNRLPNMGGIDLSPLIVLLAIVFIKMILMNPIRPFLISLFI
ncbi:YggT family protein [uncultured Agrobacterium sp.]|uniref:YggT family protein n=2 Tax=uncultured Agrobacterium sp. TaxID=157277 RepID=UPI0025DBCF75|nr:YggT family protein [uncultured Agrobacterium sp.]